MEESLYTKAHSLYQAGKFEEAYETLKIENLSIQNNDAFALKGRILLEDCKKQISKLYFQQISTQIKQKNYNEASKLKELFIKKYDFNDRIKLVEIPVTDLYKETVSNPIKDSNQPTKKNNPPYVVIGILAAVVILCVAAFFGYKYLNNETFGKKKSIHIDLYDQRADAITQQLKQEYGNDLMVENEYQDLGARYMSFIATSKYDNQKVLIIYDLEKEILKKFYTDYFKTADGEEVYLYSFSTHMNSQSDKIFIIGNNGANSIGYVEYLLAIDTNNWEIREIGSGSSVNQQTDGYTIDRHIMTKWGNSTADSEYATVSIHYDLNGNLTLPNVSGNDYEFKGLIDNKYSITMNITAKGDKIYGKYYYNKYDSSNYLFLYGGISNSSDIVILEFNKKGEKTGSFEGQIINNIFSGRFINFQNKTMPFRLTASNTNNKNNYLEQTQYLECKGDMAGFPIEMDITINSDNSISGEYRNIKYNVNYDLRGNYSNGYLSIKGYHGNATVDFDLSLADGKITGYGSDGRQNLEVSMDYTAY